MAKGNHIPLKNFETRPAEEMEKRSADFYSHLKTRRSVRDFSDAPIPDAVIENCLLAAGTAPNGANLQPWHFSVVKSPEIKAEIRKAAEVEEYEFYHGKAPQDWLDALAPLGTNASKPFLETASTLIVIFSQTFGFDETGEKVKHYYVSESVGIATGFLIAALHDAGCATLTHTPSPMKFLNRILGRPSNERPFLVLVVGQPAAGALVPDIAKKTANEISTWH
ncbi:nitroreductase family protein [Mariniblastus fucicola]|uniref:NADH dehydrogenase n=1 Tax=Mariniblastus fucicola TaxID=980251 RepID=A0A5B9PEB4_9BACT|nr:nitroreductase family protein [Mariniblastus fucicola]QEG21371.1 NADH dehydrogenase [Mariniblastus fucicola]